MNIEKTGASWSRLRWNVNTWRDGSGHWRSRTGGYRGKWRSWGPWRWPRQPSSHPTAASLFPLPRSLCALAASASPPPHSARTPPIAPPRPPCPPNSPPPSIPDTLRRLADPPFPEQGKTYLENVHILVDLLYTHLFWGLYYINIIWYLIIWGHPLILLTSTFFISLMG